jgi:hypothetical protein
MTETALAPESSLDSDAPYYAFKAAMVGGASEFRLQPDAIEMNRGGRIVRFAYRDIRRVRLAYRPVTMQSYRFVTEIWGNGPKMAIASCSSRSIVEQTRQDAEYNAFIAELHRRIAAAGALVKFQTGSPVLLYWAGVAAISGLCVASAVMAFRTLQIDSWQTAAVFGGMLVVFLWQAGGFLRRNMPGRYTPDQLPRLVLP